MSILKGKRRLVIAGAVSVAAAVAVGLGAPAMADSASSASDAKTPPKSMSNAEFLDAKCGVPANHDPAVIKKIYKIAKDRKVSGKVMLAAFEAGWVESHMNNLNCGDADSLGVFQQRPSAGWCDPAKLCRDVKHATNKFLDQAIPNDKNHPKYSAGELAQSVQRSAYPGRYDQNKAKAQRLIDAAH